MSELAVVRSSLRAVRMLLPRALRRLIFGRITRQLGKTDSFVQLAFRELLNEIRISEISKRSQKQFAALTGRKHLKLHLGAGGDIRPGWINIDLVLGNLDSSHLDNPEAVFINHDLRRGLPLDNTICSYIYSSHFLEHLSLGHGSALICECFRVLETGGTFRASLPNFRGLFEAYLKNDEEYFDLIKIRDLIPELEPGTESLVDHVNYGVYQHGEHKCIYDESKLVSLLMRAGFTSVATSSFNADIDPGDPVRRRYSFYIEATK